MKKKKETIAEHLRNESLFGKSFGIVFVVHEGQIHKFRGKDANDLRDGKFFLSIAKVKTFSEAGVCICFVAE